MSPGFRESYAAALQTYLSAREEPALQAAYELGREAVRAGLGVLDLAAAHHHAYLAALRGPGAPDDLAEAAMAFFSESLSAFEMIQRGFREVQEMALLEKRYGDQLRRLADASLAIAGTLSRAKIGWVIAEQACAVIGAECGYVFLADAEEGSMVSSHLCSRCRRYVEAADLAGLQGRVAEGGQPVSLTAIDLGRFGPWPLAKGEPEAHSVGLAAPLQGLGERLVGLVHISHPRKGDFTDNDRYLLLQLAHIGGAALDNARLYERERQTAETLQRDLLPRLARPAGIELAARYVPGSAAADVGGDWYDVVPLAEDRLGIAIGDVAGHGVRAASTMGQVRMAFRAYAVADLAPETVVEQVNRIMCALESDHFSTMAYLVVDLDRGDALAARAGHPPPLLVQAGGGTRYIEGGLSLALGVEPNQTYHHAQVPLHDSTLVLYTDGLLARRFENPLHELARVAARAPVDLEEMCAHLLEAMLPEEPDDDVALLALRLE
ncbi:MAG: SpoIIE family protein phosphatase [Acidimicrobiia bacterium]